MLGVYIEHTCTIMIHGHFVFGLELCARKPSVFDLELSSGRKFLLQRPIMICKWPWFGRAGNKAVAKIYDNFSL